jgi:hypothetical protein
MNNDVDDLIESQIRYRVITSGNDSSAFKFDGESWFEIQTFENEDNHLEIMLEICPDVKLINYNKQEKDSIWQVM